MLHISSNVKIYVWFICIKANSHYFSDHSRNFVWVLISKFWRIFDDTSISNTWKYSSNQLRLLNELLQIFRNLDLTHEKFLLLSQKLWQCKPDSLMHQSKGKHKLIINDILRLS